MVDVFIRLTIFIFIACQSVFEWIMSMWRIAKVAEQHETLIAEWTECMYYIAKKETAFLLFHNAEWDLLLL